MGKKVSLGAAIAMMIIAATVTFSITMVFAIRTFNDKVSSITERENMYEKFTEIDKYVRQNYYGKIDEDTLMDAVAKGYLSGISDPYATYMTAEQYEAYIAAESDVTAGVGITTVMEESGYMQVTQVHEGTAAAGANIQVGDLIIRIDDLDITAETYQQAVELLTGDAGTKVTLAVRRENEDSEMEITRRQLTVSTVTSSMVGTAAYIRIDAFSESTPDQFSKVVDTAISGGATALIFDVRDVATGLASSAATMLDKLLPEGDVLSVTYQSGASEVLYTSNARSVSMPMIVLVNQNTSGAAEFFAAALRDYDKCKIVGIQTAGNGALQKIFKLEDGSAVQLTVGVYTLGASGSQWNGKGVSPDHVVESTYTGYTTGGMLDTSLDTPLAKAIEVVTVGTNATVPNDSSSEASVAVTESSSSEQSEESGSSDAGSSESSGSSSGS